MEPSLTKSLVEQLKNKKITDNDRAKAALHILDWLGCCSLGKQSPAIAAYLSYIAAEQASDNSPCHVVFGTKAHWQDALLVNAAMGNVLEMDDIHRSSILHPGPVVIPAALTIAEKYQLPMRNLLNAVVLGYEITIRLGEAIGRSHYKYFHNTATCASMGAALGVAHLLNLSIEQTVSALGNVGSRTGGLWQMRNEKVHTKQWHNSEAARAGAMSAILAKQHLVGPEYILEGPQGIFAAFSSDAQPNLFLQAYDQWRIYDCSFKPWPACRHAHPAIDVVRQLVNKADMQYKPDNIQCIEIYTYQDAKVFCDNPTPTTELQAKFSIQHAIAALLMLGEPQLAHYQLHQIEPLAWCRAKINIEVTSEIEAKYPKHYGAKCRITFHDGATISHQITDTYGDPENPLSSLQIKDKAKMLMQSADIDPKNIDQLLSLEWAKTPVSRLSQLISVNE